MPRVEPNLGADDQEKYEKIRDKPETIYQFASKYPKMRFDAKTWRPIKDQD